MNMQDLTAITVSMGKRIMALERGASRGTRIQHGTVVVAGTTATVTFDKAFSEAPTIGLTCAGASSVTVRVTGRSTTGFSLATSGATTVHWQAMTG